MYLCAFNVIPEFDTLFFGLCGAQIVALIVVMADANAWCCDANFTF